MKKLIILVTCLVAKFASADCSVDSIKQTTPTEQFEIISNDIVLDKKTNLMWSRCSYGGRNTCQQNAAYLTWAQAIIDAEDAVFGGYSDWRVPNIKEMISIIERSCENNAQNSDIFQLFTDLHWTSTINGPTAWIVDARTGVTRTESVLNFNANPIVLVRDGT